MVYHSETTTYRNRILDTFKDFFERHLINDKSYSLLDIGVGYST